jgi:hypothetical protein
VTPAHRGRGAPKPPVSGAEAAKPSPPRHVGMSWARGLKRVFGVQIESCARCGGQLKIIASIEEPQLIAKILSHLERTAPEQSQSELVVGARGPPAQSCLL